MASVTHQAVIASTTNASSYTSSSFTPPASELLVVAFSPGSLVGTSPTVTASANSITFTEVTGAFVIRSSVDDARLFVANQLLPGSPAAMTITASPGGSASGLIGFVASVSSLTRVGLAAVRGAAGGNNASTFTPAVTMAQAALTGNPVLAFVWNATNTSGITIPTNFTSGVADQGYATPTRGGRYAFRNSGHTSATVTWGSTSATASANIAVELDTTANTQQAASGTVAATSAVTGDSVLNRPASGQVDGVTATSGSVDNLLRPVDAQVDLVSDASGSAGYIVGASGSVDATSATSGSANLLAAASGTVAVVSDTFGTVAPQAEASGQVDAVSGVTGSATVLAVATGTAAASTSVSGGVALLARASGTAAAVTAVSGAATGLLTAGSAAFNAIVEVFGSALLTTSATGLPVDVISGTYGSAGVATDITLSAVLAERTWFATLTPRTWEASL